MARKRRNKRRQGYGLRHAPKLHSKGPTSSAPGSVPESVPHPPPTQSHDHNPQVVFPAVQQLAEATGAATGVGAHGGTRAQATAAAQAAYQAPTTPKPPKPPTMPYDDFLDTRTALGTAQAAQHPLGTLHDLVKKQLKREQSHTYKRIEVAKAIKENVKTTDSGEPKTQTVKVPVSPDKMQEALAAFKAQVAQAETRSDIKQARHEAHQALTREVTVPDFKPGHRKAFQERLQQIQDTAEAIRSGDIHIEDLAPEQRKAIHQTVGAHTALRAMDPEHRQLAKAGIEPVSAASSVLESLSEVSNRTGVSKVFDYLTRPGAFVESGVGKLLSGEHFGPFQGPEWIHGKTAEHIHKAPGPGEAFMTGFADPKVISGGDITQGLFNARWAGLGADILLDPTTYLGGAGLIANLPKLKSVAKTEALLVKKAPEVLSDARYTRYAAIARRSGDYTELDNYLKRVVSERKIKGYVSARAVDRRLALHRGQVTELAALARKRLENAESIGGHPVRLPGSHGSAAIAEATRSAQLHRALAPGFRIRFVTPGGNEFAHIPVPLPANTPIPVFGSTMAKRLAETTGSTSRHVRLTTLDKFVEQLSRTRTLREVTRLSNDMSRTMDQEMQEALKRALKPITKTGRTNERSYNRVGLYMHARDLYQSPEAAARALGGLSKKEQKAADNLDTLFRAEAEQGKEIGTLAASIPFYYPRLWNDRATHYGATVDPVKRMEERFAPSFTTAMNASRHRDIPDIAAAADPELLTKAIKELHAGKIGADEAAGIAQDMYDLARHRGQTELLARQVQRGRVLHMDELGPTEQQVVINNSRNSDTAVFRHPDETDGILTFANAADKYHGFDDSLSGLVVDEAAAAKRYSAEKDLARTNAMRANYHAEDQTPLYTAPGEPPTTVGDIHQDLTRHIERLHKELEHNTVSRDVTVPHQEGRLTEDPLDYTGRLRDVRQDQNFPVLDPAVNAFYRSRTEAVTAALTQRWQGLDAALGRSIDEVQDFRRGKDDTIWYDDANNVKYQDPLAAGKNDALGQAIVDAVGPDRLWPTWALDDARAEAMRLGEGTYKQFFYTGMEHAFGRTMSLMRYGVTTPFPAFQIRNMISDIFKSLQAGGTGLMFHPLMTGKLVALAARREKAGLIPFTNIPGLRLRIAPGRMDIKVPGLANRMPVPDFLYMLDLFGVRNGQHLAEYLKLAQQGKRNVSRHSRLARGTMIGPEGAVGKRLIEGGARREDIMRFLTFTQRMRKNNGDVANAAWYMTKHHFDYSDLTAYEKRVMRNLFLFYTWYRKNIPLQFSEIITRPGFFAGVTNAYYDLPRGETPLNQDWSKINPMFPDMSGKMPMKGTIPDYMMNPLGAFQTNWNGHAAAFAFAAPWTDMNLAENMLNSGNAGDALKQLSSMLNPAVGLLIALGYKTDPLTGRTFRESEPTAGFVASAFKAMGVEVQTNPETGAKEIPWQLQALVRQLPILGRSAGYALPPTGVYDDKSWIATHRGLFGALSGMTPFVGPRADQLQDYQKNQSLERVGQRRDLSEGLSNVSNKVAKQKLAEFDKATLVWAKEHDIPFSILQSVEGSGFYKSQSSSSQPTLGGASGSSGTLGGASGSGSTLGGASSSSPFGSSAEKDKTPPDLQQAIKQAKLDEQRPAAATTQTADIIGTGYIAGGAKLGEKERGGKTPTNTAALTKAIATIPDMGNARDVAAYVTKLAKDRGLPPSVMMAQIEQESGFQPGLTSSAGAQGETQFMEGTAAQYNVNDEGTSAKAIQSQLRGQADLMKDNLDTYGNIETALAAYLGDPDGGQGGPEYAASIMTLSKKYAALDGTSGGGSIASAPKPRVLKKYVSLANSPEAEAAEAGVPVKRVYAVEIGKLVPEMQTALVKLAKNTGTPVTINDGYRTAYNAQQHPSGLGSAHHTGEAVDMGNIGSYTDEELDAVGLYRPYSSAAEFNHLELKTPSTTPTTSGPPVSGVPVAPAGPGYSTPSPTTPATTTRAGGLISAQRGLTPRQIVQKLRPSDYFKPTKHGLMPADYMLTAPENPASASYGLAYSAAPPTEGRYDLPIQAQVDELIARLRAL